MSAWRDEPEAALWHEAEAVRLLREVGAVVKWLEAQGVRIPNRERYHRRIVETHNAKDMAAYREAINGYEEAARDAYRRLRREEDEV